MRVKFQGEVMQVCGRRDKLVCLMDSSGMAEWVHETDVKPVNVVRRMREQV